MTASELVDSPEFKGFCEKWKDDGRCPLPFADWLREQGLDGQADAAYWAATEPERRVFLGNHRRSGISPNDTKLILGSSEENGRWMWSHNYFNTEPFCHDLPLDVLGQIPIKSKYIMFAEAIAAFLDAWAKVRQPVGELV
jgi:hypothetical protein